jgi:hypothetical protein
VAGARTLVKAKPAGTALRAIAKAVAGRQHRHCQAEADKPQWSLGEQWQERAPGQGKAR